jgi:DNA-binding response OmpR family regulator
MPSDPPRPSYEQLLALNSELALLKHPLSTRSSALPDWLGEPDGHRDRAYQRKVRGSAGVPVGGWLMRVLLVEDDDTIAEPLTEGLGRYGFQVSRVSTGAAALDAPPSEILLLDLGLPDMDGIDVCRRLRTVTTVPIIMLTARGSETDRVVGLEIGADDYLAKPFSMRELVARMRALGRRSGWQAVAGPAADGPVVADPTAVGLVVDRRSRQVQLDGRPLALSPKEFDLLAILAEDPGAVVTRQRLIDACWGPRFFGAGKTLDFHIASLRRKLGDPTWIETRRGVGFLLIAPTQTVPFRPATSADR